jgi:hypothetical protein
MESMNMVEKFKSGLFMIVLGSIAIMCFIDPLFFGDSTLYGYAYGSAFGLASLVLLLRILPQRGLVQTINTFGRTIHAGAWVIAVVFCGVGSHYISRSLDKDPVDHMTLIIGVVLFVMGCKVIWKTYKPKQ